MTAPRTPHTQFPLFALQARVAHTRLQPRCVTGCICVRHYRVPQLWQVPIDGGWPDQITFTDDRVTAGHYAHGSDTLVFGMDSGGDEREQLFVLRDGSSEIWWWTRPCCTTSVRSHRTTVAWPT
jgi:hypothetical protein